MHGFCLNDEQMEARRAAALNETQELADLLFAASQTRPSGAPLEALQQLRDKGLLVAPVERRFGGLGLGVEPGSHLSLLRVLATLGGADLAVARLYEGHVNALLLIAQYGNREQRRHAAEDAHAGMLFAVWNSGEPRVMRLEEDSDGLTLHGVKTFATGATFVQRPVVTAERHGWQMVLPRMETPEVGSAVQIDRESWQPFGMESSESLTIDFSGARVETGDLLGEPGDFYREPLFRGGAIRFAAAQAGALLRLSQTYADWVTTRGRQGDPYQIARVGEVELLAQEAVLWIERAAATAETCFSTGRDDQANTRMVHCGNMTRLAIERAATAMMGYVVPGIGAHGLLRPARFERMLRDLTMYLRQPNPDGTLAEVGRSALLAGRGAYWSSAFVQRSGDEELLPAD